MTDAFAEAIGLTKVVDPRQRPAARRRPGTQSQRRRRSRPPRDAFEEAITPAEPQQEAAPVTQAPEQPPAAPSIDFDAPVPEVREAIDALPKEQQQAAIDEWAKRYVAKEREGGGVLQTATDRVRDLARGTPVGSWLDEANAQTSDVLHRAGLGGAPYRESVAYQRARDEAADEESTKLGTLPLVGDVHTSGVTKVAGGLLSAPVTPIVNAVRGATILPQMANAALTGATYGTLYGSGEGDTVTERGQNALVGGGAGVLLGAGLPVALQGARSTVNALSRRPTPNAISQYHPGARQRLQRAVSDDLVSPSGRSTEYTAQSGRLGQQGMLADMGPNLIGQADAVANQPGAGKTIVRRALRARDRTAQDRINQATTRALGPDVDASTQVDTFMELSREAAGPLYRQFRETPVDISPRLRRIMGRVRALIPGIDEEIATLMVADDVPQDIIQNNGAVLDYMKRAVDAAATKWRGAEKNADRARIASNLARDLRDEVDRILSPNNPSESIYAQAREEAGRGLQFRQGVKEGKQVLDDKISLGQMRINNQQRTPAEMEGVRTGAREEIRRKMSTAKSAFDETSQNKAAATAGRRVLSSQETRGKVADLVGPGAARDLTRTLDAEGHMAGVSNAIQGNSATAGRVQAQREFPNAVAVNSGQAANELGKKNLTGLLMETGYRIANFVLDGALDERRIMIARDAAEMLVSQGARRDEIAQALIQAAQRNVRSDAHRDAIMGLAQGIIRGATPAASKEAVAGFNG